MTNDNKPGVPNKEIIPIVIKFTGTLMFIEETNRLKLYKNTNANNILFSTLIKVLSIISPKKIYV